MKNFLYFVAVLLIISAQQAYAGTSCGSSLVVSPSDREGSVRLIYVYDKRGDRLELIQRQNDDVVIARGLLLLERIHQEIYAIYDQKTGNLVHARTGMPSYEWGNSEGFAREYKTNILYTIKVFSPGKVFGDRLTALLERNQEQGCQEEMVKMSQGRKYDGAKCGEMMEAFNEIMRQLVQPASAGFVELTAHTQMQKFIKSIQAERSKTVLGIFIDSRDPDGENKAACTSIEKMEMKMIHALRDPETQKKLAVKTKMPGYLD